MPTSKIPSPLFVTAQIFNAEEPSGRAPAFHDWCRAAAENWLRAAESAGFHLKIIGLPDNADRFDNSILIALVSWGGIEYVLSIPDEITQHVGSTVVAHLPRDEALERFINVD